MFMRNVYEKEMEKRKMGGRKEGRKSNDLKMCLSIGLLPILVYLQYERSGCLKQGGQSFAIFLGLTQHNLGQLG